MKDKIKKRLQESSDVKNMIAGNEELLSIVEKSADVITQSLKNGGQLLVCGNGGSAADAQHIAAELSGKYYIDREPLSAEALHVNTSYLTAVGNDYSYNEIFSRAVGAKGSRGDVLIAISTSGNSKNVVSAVEKAKEKGLLTIGMTGSDGGKMRGICDYLIAIPSQDTPRIQEAHITIGHIICELVEVNIFG
ncbi:MAG: D-sedoheptulose 7-phosphate isomerase [Candidatus Spechtbacterales bacterium]|nr:D-sedoheptulose 7-phosphate isomerase [Candidatus Spechtbacterales bacterium]